MSDEPRRIKQVVVMRHDLQMRRGKQIAQGAHASMSFICRRLQDAGAISLDAFTDAQRAWLTGAFAKVCCRVDSEEELMDLHDVARSWPGVQIEFAPELLGGGPRKHMMCSEPGGIRVEFIWPGN